MSFDTPGLYTATILVTAQDGEVGYASGTYRVPPPNPPSINDVRWFAVGSAAGGMVSVYLGSSATPYIVGAPYPGFTGGVAVAWGDVLGDGLEDLVTVVASGGPTQVDVFDGATFALRLSFYAFPTSYTGGASVAVGDLDGYGRASIIVGQSTGGSCVAVYDGPTGALHTAFFAYPGAPVGVNVAAGDLNGDGKDEIVTGPTGLAPLVRAFDGSGNMLLNFFAFDPTVARVGVTVGVADLDGDPHGDILVGANVNGANFVLTFNGDAALRNILPLPPTSPPNSISPSGPPVAGADLTADAVVDLLVTVGPVLGAFGGRDLSLLTVIVPYPGYSGGLYVG
ncbi:FG-GAP repeat domain-containing protein [Frigoriglobus tundricola]|uniref:VCBS repeat-containing protein n=1 Tax=Frigoriglobus tundricola TaxID=2774151 RepID=A0A6M5YP36_9BACT|nr:VCBS repeat-containing protein [Frigoriglobus tundricola]QJW94991.1 hypothetical protein FTUN_2517 [Frigoriglobus tundricola]